MTDEADDRPPLPALTGSGAPDAGQPWSTAAPVPSAALPPFPDGPLAPLPPPADGPEVVFTWSGEDFAAPLPPALAEALTGPRPQENGVSSRRTLLIAACIVAAVIGARELARRNHLPSLAGAALFVLSALTAGAVLALLFWYVYARRSGAERNRQNGEQLLRLTPVYLYHRAAWSESKTQWEGVAGVADGEKHLFIAYHSGAYLSIPKRAFASDTEAKAFYDEAVALWKAGGG